MAKAKVYKNSNWEIFGGGQLQIISGNPSPAINVPNNNSFVTVANITKPAWATYGIATGYLGITQDGAGSVQLSMGNTSGYQYIQDQYYKTLSFSAILQDDDALSIRSTYKTGSISTYYIRILWF